MSPASIMRQRIFVGSSSEDLPAAKAIRDNLAQAGHTVKLWSLGIFSIGRTAFESLLSTLDTVDAAVFVFAPNDLVTIRGVESDAIRDNVLFELGLFTGRLGRDRTFWVVPKGQAHLRIASDLMGVLPAEYEKPRDNDWLSALPANEFFDDECVTDVRSAVGAFASHHFGNQVEEFSRLVAMERQQLRAVLVQRELNQYVESYGVGTSLWFNAPLGTRLRLILTAVTRKRVGEGLKAEPAYLFAAVRSISRIMNDQRLTELHLPLFGAGHGDMDPRVALFCLTLALATTPDIRQANLVVFRRTADARPSIAPDVAKRILSSVVAELRR